MRRILVGAVSLLFLATGAGAVAAGLDDGGVGTRAWCDATWTGLARNGEGHGETRRHYVERCLARCPGTSEKISTSAGVKTRSWRRARWRDLRLSGRPVTQTFDEFSQSCALTCPAPDAPVGRAVPASASLGTSRSPAAISALVLGAAGVAAAAAAGSSHQDPPASP